MKGKLQKREIFNFQGILLFPFLSGIVEYSDKKDTSLMNNSEEHSRQNPTGNFKDDAFLMEG